MMNSVTVYKEAEEAMMTSYRTEYWTRTSGDLADRRTPIPTPEVKGNDAAANAVKIVIDPTRQYQLWEGAGAAITDSSASCSCSP